MHLKNCERLMNTNEDFKSPKKHRMSELIILFIYLPPSQKIKFMQNKIKIHKLRKLLK